MSDSVAQSPLQELFSRRVGAENLHRIQFEMVDDDRDVDWHAVEVTADTITVRGSSDLALARGAYAYLRDNGYYYYGWDGERIAFPATFDGDDGARQENKFQYRPYLNVCTYGYSTPWWDWQRWEREIDWMALRGVNMPVAMEGQEFVWRKLWREMGLSETEIEQHFSGAAFLPWQRMGNIEAHEGPLSDYWIEKKRVLQTKILERMRRMGMEPVTPAFAGYVPKSFMARYPEANVIQTDAWSPGFEGTYWLDPNDPLFSEIGARFLEIYRETYGETRFHLADAFNEIIPPVSTDTKNQELEEYGRVIFESIKAANPDGIWVMQGWQFGYSQEFWTPDAVEAFLNKVPDDDVMIHDIGNDVFPLWPNLNAFSGKSWVYGVIHNFGATDAIFGDFDYYEDQYRQLNDANDAGNLVGFGIFPEGIEQNAVIYDYLLDLPWSTAEHDWHHWIERYLNARYGSTTPAIMKAWSVLEEQLYSLRYWLPRRDHGRGTYLVNKRPTLSIVDFSGHPGDASELRAALEILISEAAHYDTAPVYQYDLIEFTRHYVSQRIDAMLMDAIRYYSNGDLEAGDLSRRKANQMTSELDALLFHQPGRRLTDWLEGAAAWAEDDDDRSTIVQSAKMQVTLWGGSELGDYASKSWAGMYAPFYMARWNSFFDALRASKVSNTPFDENRIREDISQWEEDWVRQEWSDPPIDSTSHRQPIARIQDLLSLTKPEPLAPVPGENEKSHPNMPATF